MIVGKAVGNKYIVEFGLLVSVDRGNPVTRRGSRKRGGQVERIRVELGKLRILSPGQGTQYHQIYDQSESLHKGVIISLY